MNKRFALWVIGNTDGYIWPQVYWEYPKGRDGRENKLQPDTRVYRLVSDPINVEELKGFHKPIQVNDTSDSFLQGMLVAAQICESFGASNAFRAAEQIRELVERK